MFDALCAILVSMVFLPPLNYECVHCGNSCEMFEVDVDPGLVLPGAQTRPDGRLYLRCLPDGCPNLSEASEDRCLVYEQRPGACRHFPFRAIDTPGGRFIGASFACTAVAQGSGPRIGREDRDWAELPAPRVRAQLVEGQPCPWETYLKIEEFLGDQLCFSNGAFSAALGVSLALAQDHWAGLGVARLSWLSDEVESTCQRILRGLLAISEADDQPQRAQQVLSSQAQGGRYFSCIFPGWVEPRQIQARLEQEEPEHWQQVEGFFRHLLFRKFLWGPPSVHARVCLLPLINEMIRYWTWQQALAESSRPTALMRRLAVREVERRLTFHAQGWEDFLAPLSLAFLQGVR
ncbi:MAG: YkgJ family cysteine cluster protein [Candidatus Eremiobacteraeota bacterium]|nr:YkgJ family cysteine cluster protein [Candidatus Eremiobacteraeota bacterium]